MTTTVSWSEPTDISTFTVAVNAPASWRLSRLKYYKSFKGKGQRVEARSQRIEYCVAPLAIGHLRPDLLD